MSVKFTTDQFAYSLFSAAEKKNKTEEIEKSLGQLVQLYKKNPEFRFVLLSKRISKSQKSEILMKSLDKKISSISIEILDVLLENDRVGELTLLMRSYQNIISEKSKSAKVSCTVAQPLGQEQIVELEQIIGSKLDKNIDMKINVDPNILGGMILRVDNSIIDGSVKTQLNKIRKNFTLK